MEVGNNELVRVGVKPGFICTEEKECLLAAIRKHLHPPLLQGPAQRRTDTQRERKGRDRNEVGVREGYLWQGP